MEHARKHGIDPAYELARLSGEALRPLAGLQTLYVADELDSRLARIAADARLAEQETGLSTLFLAFGFLRWYERNDSDVANFAPRNIERFAPGCAASRRVPESRPTRAGASGAA